MARNTHRNRWVQANQPTPELLALADQGCPFCKALPWTACQHFTAEAELADNYGINGRDYL